MRRLLAALALALLASACRTVPPPQPLPPDAPRVRALLEGWRALAEERSALFAVARFAVDAAGAGVGGDDLSLRSKERLWLARPAQLRVEVLGFLDTTLAVLATDGSRYALFQAEDRSFEAGEVYDRLLWDVARLDLSSSEAVEVVLGAPRWDPGLLPIAYAVGDQVRIELVTSGGNVRRVVDFDAAGRPRRLEQRSAWGAPVWEAVWDDYRELEGEPFAHRVALRSASGNTEARLSLRDVELNPSLPPETFRLQRPVPETAER